MKFRVTLTYEYEVAPGSLAEYDDPSPEAMAAVDQEAMTDDPMIVMDDLRNLPTTIKVVPV